MEKSKVVILRCETYEKALLKEKINEAIHLLGGYSKIFGEDKETPILFKPNFLRPKEAKYHVTTNPVVFSAIGELLKENGYNALSYGDSPSMTSGDVVAKACGIWEAAKELEISYEDFEKFTLLDAKDAGYSRFAMANPVIHSTKIVNLPKMKAHQLTKITGCVKNFYGVISGKHKGMGHALYPNSSSFGSMLLEIYKLIKPKVALNILDGITAMEGNGPANGTLVNMNVLIISQDALSADSVFCRLIALSPKVVPYLRDGETGRLGNTKEENIILLGDDIEPLINKDFKVEREVPKTRRKSRFYKKYIEPRPIIDKKLCVKCNLCVKMCPKRDKGALKARKDFSPVYDYEKCIRCYCCQEVCPKGAIQKKLGFFARMFGG